MMSTFFLLFSLVSLITKMVQGANILTSPLCNEYLECRTQLLNRHWMCTEKTRKITEEACKSNEKFRSLFSTSLRREREITDCVRREAAIVDASRINVRLPESCLSLSPIRPIRGCWGSLSIEMRRCDQLRKCCPPAEICAEDIGSSLAARDLVNERDEAVRQMDECRTKMYTALGTNMTPNDIATIRAIMRHGSEVSRMVVELTKEKKYYDKKVSGTSTVTVSNGTIPTEQLEREEINRALREIIENKESGDSHRKDTVALRGSQPIVRTTIPPLPLLWAESANGVMDFGESPEIVSPSLPSKTSSSLKMQSVDSDTKENAMVVKVQSSGYNGRRARLHSRDEQKRKRKKQEKTTTRQQTTQQESGQSTDKSSLRMQSGIRPHYMDSQLESTKSLIDLLTSERDLLHHERKATKGGNAERRARLFKHSTTIRKPWSREKMVTSRKVLRRRKKKTMSEGTVALKRHGESRVWRDPRVRSVLVPAESRDDGYNQVIGKISDRRIPSLLLVRQNVSRTVATHRVPFRVAQPNSNDLDNIYEDILGETNKLNIHRVKPLEQIQKTTDIQEDFDSAFDRRAGTLVSFASNAIPLPGSDARNTTRTPSEDRTIGEVTKDVVGNDEMEGVVNEGGTWTMQPRALSSLTEHGDSLDPLTDFERQGDLRTAEVADLGRIEPTNIPSRQLDYIDITEAGSTTTELPSDEGEEPSWTPSYDKESRPLGRKAVVMTTPFPSIDDSLSNQLEVESIALPLENPVSGPLISIDHDVIHRSQAAPSYYLKSMPSNSDISNDRLWPFRRVHAAKTFQPHAASSTSSRGDLLAELTRPTRSASVCSLYHSCLSLISLEQLQCPSSQSIDNIMPGLPKRGRALCMKRLLPHYQEVERAKNDVEAEFSRCVWKQTVVLKSEERPTTEECSASLSPLRYFSVSDPCPRRLRTLLVHCDRLASCCTAAARCRKNLDDTENVKLLEEKKRKLSKESQKCPLVSNRMFKRQRIRRS